MNTVDHQSFLGALDDGGGYYHGWYNIETRTIEEGKEAAYCDDVFDLFFAFEEAFNPHYLEMMGGTYREDT